MVTTNPEPSSEALLPRPEALVISDAERDLLGRFGAIVRTPRAAKRLVNIYRMLRVSVPEDETEDFRPGGGDEYQAVIVLLSILVGRPSQAQDVFASIMNSADDTDVWQIFSQFDCLTASLPAARDIQLNEAAVYRRWAPRVSRFSFRLATVLTPDEPPT